MKPMITLPDDVASQVGRLRNPDELLRQAVRKALDETETSPLEAGPSRWARLAKRVESESTSLGDYYVQFKKDLYQALRS